MRVRCCADQPSVGTVAPASPIQKSCTELGWTPTAAGSPYVCANSEFYSGTGKVCSTAATFSSARNACRSIGARLCTSEELDADNARGSGCKLDDKIVWSKTPCTGGQLAQYGSYKEGAGSVCKPVNSRAGVRCCAEQPQSKTRFSCEDLQWPIKNGACAQSKIKGKCYGKLNFQDAKALCESVGTTICTSGEIEADVAQFSGCKLDTERVWTSSSCGTGMMTRAGGSTSAKIFLPQCATVNTMHYVRCCTTSSTTSKLQNNRG